MESKHMELKGKALFNLLKISALENPKLGSKPWQVEDMRHITTQVLFERLNKMHLSLNENSFRLYAEEVECPEELVDCVWMEKEDDEGKEHAYLILFELWRRLFPDKQCLSILCDELDYLIEAYDRDKLKEEEPLQEALCLLEDVLDDACDTQASDPEAILQEVSEYCAHDLEHFLYDYTCDQIDNDDATYASELIDAFYEYISDKKWFDFLRARLAFLTDSDESNFLIERLLEQLSEPHEDPDIAFLMQIIDSLVHYGDTHLFRRAVKQSVPLLKTEQQFQELLSMSADFFRCLDKEDEEKRINTLLKKRTCIHAEKMLDRSDAMLKEFCGVVF